jgi:acetoin:2,6-dichlorophenolindophenol oxidoreductase subunit alpha
MPELEKDPILELKKEDVHRLYETMLKIRFFESREKEILPVEQEGFAHAYIGEEAIAVGVCAALNQDDYITSTHRGHGHVIAKGADMNRMMAELYGKVTGYCKGKSGSLHIADFNIGILGANGIVGAGVPHAVGAAYSIALRKSNQVSVAFFGDGALNQGCVHEALVMASVWKLPVVFAVEVNHWQCGVRAEWVYKPDVYEDLTVRGKGYGIPSEKVDGNDVVSVYEAATKAVERARAGMGPTMLFNYTYRIETHFVGDIDIRPVEEIEGWRKKDPIENLERRMIKANLMSGAEIEDRKDKTLALVEEAIDFGRKSPKPTPDVALEDVYVKF